MKKLALLFVVFVAVNIGFAQSTYYRAGVSDTSRATTSWDSVYLGGDYFKVVTVTHDSTAGVLLYATENDTTAGKIKILRALTGYGETKTFYTNARWLRTKAQSGELLRRVESDQAPIVR